jgi:hypothetical protein
MVDIQMCNSAVGSILGVDAINDSQPVKIPNEVMTAKIFNFKKNTLSDVTRISTEEQTLNSLDEILQNPKLLGIERDIVSSV